MSKYKIEIKWSFIYAIALLVWIVFEKEMGWHDIYVSKQPFFSLFFTVLSVAVYYFALREKKTNTYQNIIHWKEAFISGTVMSIFASLISLLVFYIMLTVISPSFLDNMSNYSVQRNVYTTQQAQSFFSVRNYLLQNFGSSLSTGIVISAIISYFIQTKKNK